ncbi:sugar kinase [Halomarina litorea]|uniref:sugar kinase n=1 Tax=Halomarina litorea TaxID=2961595 RepID=UPI0020C2FD88|nr:sugar kinase [Halomarina sp. BCD28]
MTDVLTVGETMVLMNPTETGPLRYADRFSKRIGGAESNVAIGLARLGHDATWVSRVGEDPHGRYVRDTVRGEGVTTEVAFDPDAPTGLMFKERREVGESRVFYYRDGSAASRLDPEDVPASVVGESEFLHLTGITPALSASCRDLCFEAAALAREQGTRVSFDPNLRFKLWDEDAMRETLLPLAERADVVFPGVEEGKVLLGTTDPAEIAAGFRDREASEVVVTLGGEGAYVATADVAERVPAVPVERVVDTVGAGDGFVAGYLSGRLDGLEPLDAAKRAAACGALATTVAGDIEGLPTRADLERFAADTERVAR